MGKHGKSRARDSARSNRIEKQKRDLKNALLVRAIRKFDDPILTQVCEPVEEADRPQLKGWIDLMIRTLKATKNGIGLAAPQVGIAKRILVYRTSLGSNDFTVMINPLLVKPGLSTVISIEGCLSYPGYSKRVQRYTDVEVTWKSENWTDKKDTLGSRAAIIFQHENEHLDGKCELKEVWEIATGRKEAPKPSLEDITKDDFGFEEPNFGATPGEDPVAVGAVAGDDRESGDEDDSLSE